MADVTCMVGYIIVPSTAVKRPILSFHNNNKTSGISKLLGFY